MNSFLIVFSVIVLANAKPANYNEQQYDDGSTNVSGESDENSSVIASHPTGIFTKYPDDPSDSYSVPILYDLPPEDLRFRRQLDRSETDSSKDVLNKQSDQTEDIKQAEQVKVPLRSFIGAIESDLVSKAFQVNAQLNQRRRKRSTERILQDDDNVDDDDEDSKKSINNTVEDSVDVNQNFFEGLFNYTRPERESADKDAKIALNGLVHAVETTLINSAQNLKDVKPSKRELTNSTEETPPEFSAGKSNESHRINRDIVNEPEAKKQPDIKVAQIASATASTDLNILGPIAFKTIATTEETTQSDDETVSTTEAPIHKTNFAVIKASNSLHLIPGADKKLAHIQKQQISQTVFSSNLAIFPTIPPQSINAPLPTHIPTTEEPIESTITPKISTNIKTEQDLKHEQLLLKAQKLKEKFAEIQAEPVILSQF